MNLFYQMKVGKKNFPGRIVHGKFSRDNFQQGWNRPEGGGHFTWEDISMEGIFVEEFSVDVGDGYPEFSKNDWN